MVWHNLRMYIHESHSYRVTRTRVTHTPPGPPAGALPLHPARGPKAGPWTPPKIGSRLRARYVRSAHMFAPPKKSARAYALAMCAPRTCLPKKKIGPQQFKKIGSRFALAMCATRTCLPPHNQSLPPSCPPTFKILVPPLCAWCARSTGVQTYFRSMSC